MATLPTTTFYWRLQGGADDSWTEDADGVITPTAGQTIEVVSVGASKPAFRAADTTPSVSLTAISAGYGSSVAVNPTYGGTNRAYSIIGPDWLSIDASTGQVTGTAPLVDFTGSYTVTVTNADGSASATAAVTVTAAETLAIPGDPFPVALQRTSSAYSTDIDDVMAAALASFAGATIYVESTGDDTTGDGSSGAPYATLTKAITEATAGDRIQIVDSIQTTMPGAMPVKRLAIIGPATGEPAYIGGGFDDLSTTAPTWNATFDAWSIAEPSGGQVSLFLLRRDGMWGGAHGTRATINVNSTDGAVGDLATLTTQGLRGTFSGGSSSLTTVPTGYDLPAEVTAGNILAVREDHTLSVTLGAELYIGANIVIAAASTIANGNVLEVNGHDLWLDGCEVYGGQQTVENRGTGGQCVMRNVRGGSAFADCFDYRDNTINVEVGVTVLSGGNNAATNASTDHDTCKTLSVGCTYAGMERVVHSVGATQRWIFESTMIGAGASGLLVYGLTTDATQLVYGNVTFSGAATDNVLDFGDGSASATQINSGDAWSPPGA